MPHQEGKRSGGYYKPGFSGYSKQRPQEHYRSLSGRPSTSSGRSGSYQGPVGSDRRGASQYSGLSPSPSHQPTPSTFSPFSHSGHTREDRRAGLQTFHITDLANPRFDPKGAAEQRKQIVVKPMVNKNLLDVIDWRGDDGDSIVKRGTMITNFKDTLRLLDEHVQRMGLGPIFSMWMQVSPDGWGKAASDCFSDAGDDNTNLLSLVDYRRSKRAQVCLWQEAINANGDKKMVIANSYGKELLELCCTTALWDRVYE